MTLKTVRLRGMGWWSMVKHARYHLPSLDLVCTGNRAALWSCGEMKLLTAEVITKRVC